MKAVCFALLSVALAGCTSCGCPDACSCVDAVPKVSIFATCIKLQASRSGVSCEEAASMFRRTGVTGFDCECHEPLLPRLARSALKPASLYGCVDVFAADGGAAGIDHLVATAVRYGVPRIMIVFPEFPPNTDPEPHYARARDGLAKAVAKGRAAGLSVMIEDYGGTDNLCSHSSYLKRLLADIPELDCALDSGNLHYAGRGDDILDLMRFAEGRIRHVHLKDLTKDNNRKYVTLGLGAVPNEEIVRALASRGYDGWYTLENTVDPDRLADACRQIAVLRHWLGR